VFQEKVDLVKKQKVVLLEELWELVYFYCLDLEAVGKVVDWVYEEMVMKVVDFNFEVELVEEDKTVVEKKDMVS